MAIHEVMDAIVNSLLNHEAMFVDDPVVAAEMQLDTEEGRPPILVVHPEKGICLIRQRDLVHRSTTVVQRTFYIDSDGTAVMEVHGWAL